MTGDLETDPSRADPAPAASTTSVGRFAHQPALDGLRAVAVTMVLLFHADISWMKGGYFGVSIFFTLSGFLITSLLVNEVDGTGRVAAKTFYARRLRRLLPASLVCIAGVCVLGAFDVWKGIDHLRRDSLGALFQVANWVQLFAGESYTDLQSKQAGLISPLAHYWSLAIEEQFYWIWPFAFWGLFRLAKRTGRSLLSVMAGLTLIFAFAAPLISVIWGTDATYWASPARAAEILLGATLAIAVHTGRVRPRPWMTAVGSVGVVALAVVLPAAGGPAYHGAFPVLAIVTVVLLLGLQRPTPVSAALSTRPVVWVGQISYGLYLYHFPIFVWLSPERTDRSGGALLVIRLLVTVVVAALSSRLIEKPIRFGGWSIRRTFSATGVATAVACGLVLLIPATTNANYFEPDQALVDAAEIQPVGSIEPLIPLTPPSTSLTAPSSDPSSEPTTDATTDITSDATAGTESAADASETTGPAGTTDAVTTTSTIDPFLVPVTIPPLSRPVRIMVVGDSTAVATGAGMVRWAAANPTIAQVSLEAAVGCALVRGGLPDDPFEQKCNDHLDKELPKVLVDLQPDVVMLMVTVGDILPREWDAGEGLLEPTDPRYITHLTHDYQAITDVIHFTTKARIVWIKPPVFEFNWYGGQVQSNDFLAVRDAVVESTIAANADTSELLDLAGWMDANGVSDDHDARLDGLHFTEDAAYAITSDWLGPSLVAAATRPAVDPQRTTR